MKIPLHVSSWHQVEKSLVSGVLYSYGAVLSKSKDQFTSVLIVGFVGVFLGSLSLQFIPGSICGVCGVLTDPKP